MDSPKTKTIVVSLRNANHPAGRYVCCGFKFTPDARAIDVTDDQKKIIEEKKSLLRIHKEDSQQYKVATGKQEVPHSVERNRTEEELNVMTGKNRSQDFKQTFDSRMDGLMKLSARALENVAKAIGLKPKKKVQEIRDQILEEEYPVEFEQHQKFVAEKAAYNKQAEINEELGNKQEKERIDAENKFKDQQRNVGVDLSDKTEEKVENSVSEKKSTGVKSDEDKNKEDKRIKKIKKEVQDLSDEEVTSMLVEKWGYEDEGTIEQKRIALLSEEVKTDEQRKDEREDELTDMTDQEVEKEANELGVSILDEEEKKLNNNQIIQRILHEEFGNSN